MFMEIYPLFGSKVIKYYSAKYKNKKKYEKNFKKHIQTVNYYGNINNVVTESTRFASSENTSH